jgi:aminoglycoside phosphotransferase
MMGAPVPVAARSVRDGRWSCVGTRSSGATVYRVDRRVDGRPDFYVKATAPREPDDPRFQPAGEADRLRWLSDQGLPVPEVVEVSGNGECQWLVTTALPGRSAAGNWGQEERLRVVDVVADVARAVHSLPVAECPFDRSLSVLLGQAKVAVRAGAVDLADVDDDHRGWTAQELLDELTSSPPPAEDDLVVCHGDLCLDNVLIAPETLSLAGIVDAGRVGIADRWLDLSVAVNDIGADEKWGYGPADADRFLRRYGIADIDRRKLAYYQLIDEFM